MGWARQPALSLVTQRPPSASFRLGGSRFRLFRYGFQHGLGRLFHGGFCGGFNIIRSRFLHHFRCKTFCIRRRFFGWCTLKAGLFSTHRVFKRSFSCRLNSFALVLSLFWRLNLGTFGNFFCRRRIRRCLSFGNF